MNRTPRAISALAAAISLLAILALPGAAAAKDRNHDRIPDRWEKRHRLSLAVDQARRDQDRDRLRNLAEFEAGTNPRSADSDADGIPDGKEHAGDIASFDPQSGTLTIDLFGGGTVSGLVTDETEIECDASGAEASSAGTSEDDEGDGEDEPEGEAADDGPDEQVGDDDGADNESGDGDEDGAGEEGGERGPGSNCTTAALVPGATVDEAELRLENGAATFEKVELAG